MRAGCVHGTLVPSVADLLYASGVEHLAVTDTIPLSSDNKGSEIAVCSVKQSLCTGYSGHPR